MREVVFCFKSQKFEFILCLNLSYIYMENSNGNYQASSVITGSVQDQLDVLSSLLKDVFLPIQAKNVETRKSLEKFISHISHTSVQVSGTVSIELPIVPVDTNIEDDIKDAELMNNYLSAM